LPPTICGCQPELALYERHIELLYWMYWMPRRRAMACWLPCTSVAKSQAKIAAASDFWVALLARLP
jgi:hypothetical protein